jgi:hypothetical protein
MDEQRVEVAELAAQPVLSIRETIPVARLGDTIGELIPVLSQFLRKRGTPPAGPPYVRYHTFTDTETDMEFDVPVTQPTPGPKRPGSGGPGLQVYHWIDLAGSGEPSPPPDPSTWRGVFVFVEESAKVIASADVQMRDHGGAGDRFGQRM